MSKQPYKLAPQRSPDAPTLVPRMETRPANLRQKDEGAASMHMATME
ncbi:hypothetical protein [Haematomicrobium sanguinis]|nr:hypothetical protein [Haematomicrobium sanguinis]